MNFWMAMRQAPVTAVIILLNVLVFVAMLVSGVGFDGPSGEVAVQWGSNYGPFTVHGQEWRLFTAMFLHFGILHIGMNMLALYQNGPVVEHMFGRWRYALIYLGGGLVGSLFSVGWNPEVNSAGASGAIFAVIGAMLAFVLDPRNGVPRRVMVAQSNSILTFIAMMFVFSLSVKGIDNACHAGGLLGGIGFGFLLAPRRR